MTSAGTVAQLAGRIPLAWILRLFVWVRLVVVRVTTRTVGLKCREPPVDRFSVALMTFRAREITAMVLRVIRQARMLVIRRCPRIRVMT